MATPGGYQGIVLGSVFGNPGEALDQQIALKERRDEREAQMRQQAAAQKERQQQQYGTANLKNLNEATDASKMMLGDQYHNDVMNTQLKDFYNSMIGQVNSVDPATFDYLVHNGTSKIVNWHNQFKQDLDYSTKRTDDILKSNPNLDLTETKKAAKQLFDDKYFKQDVNGNMIPKDPEEIDSNKDPLEQLTTDRMQGILAVGGGDVIKKAIQSDKLHPEDFSKYSSNKGFVNANTYDIGVSGLKELTHDTQGNPVLKMKTEDFHLGNGVNLKMLPKETFESYMSDPAFRSGFYKLWNPVADKIEENFAKSGGSIDPQSEKMLQRDFLRKYIEDNNLDLSFIQEKQKQIVPKDRVSNNFFFGNQQQPFNPQTTKTALDRIGEESPLVGKITTINKDGTVTDNTTHQPYTTDENHPLPVVHAKDLPAGLFKLMIPYLTKEEQNSDYFNLDVKDGKIQGIKTKNGKRISTQEIYNAELKDNSEPQRQIAQPNYGNQNIAPKQNNSKSKGKPQYRGLDEHGNPIFN